MGCDTIEINLVLSLIYFSPLWEPGGVWLHQDPCPVVLHLKPESVGAINKVISTSLNKEPILEFSFEYKLVQEVVLAILWVVVGGGGGDHGEVVASQGGRVEVVRQEGGDQGRVISIQTVKIWPVKGIIIHMYTIIIWSGGRGLKLLVEIIGVHYE